LLTAGFIHSVSAAVNPTANARGETHLAYYFFTRYSGKLHKFYVRKADIATFAEMVAKASLERRQKRRSNKSCLELLTNFRRNLSDNDGVIKSLKGGCKNG
jgi:hypothetical protein